MIFTLHNSLLVIMSETVLAGLPGPIVRSNRPADLRDEVKHCRGKEGHANACWHTRSPLGFTGNLLASRREYGDISPGDPTTFTSGNFLGFNAGRVVYGVALSYKIKAMGMTLQTREICREFQSFCDSEGRTRIVPNP